MSKENENLNKADVSSSDDWVNLKYIGESYEIMEGVMFEKGTKSGLPKDIWEQTKNDESMKYWVVV